MNRTVLNAWAKPLMDALRELEDIARHRPGDASMLAEIEKMINELPVPDYLALGSDMAEAMERAAVDEVVDGVRKLQRVAALAAGDRNFAPLEDAIDRMNRKTPIVSSLNSEQWARVPLAFRERGQFSAGVKSIELMANVQSKLVKAISHQREILTNGKERYVSRDSFIRDIRQIALDEGLDTGKGNVLTNIAAARRIGLIYDMQNAQAAGHARWKLDNDKDALAVMPAWRLGPSSAREPRPASEWLAKWQEAGNAVSWKGAVRNQMVALKTSPIWMRLSTFGTPWPPFDWGSTRELEDVWRDEAEQLGLVKPNETIEPTAGRDFNDELEASVTDWRPDQISTLELAFGDQVEFANGRVAWRAPEKPFKSYIDFGLPDSSTWTDLTMEPRRIDSRQGVEMMREGVSVRGRAGHEVKFTQETLDHWKGYADERIRPTFLNFAIDTVRNPREVWKQSQQDVYIGAFAKPLNDRYKGCVVAVRKDGVAKTYFVESMDRLNKARKGIGLWNRG